MKAPHHRDEPQQQPCARCRSTGSVWRWVESRSSDIPVRVEDTCSACAGKGFVMERPAPKPHKP